MFKIILQSFAIASTSAKSDTVIRENFIWEHFTSFQERFHKEYDNFEITRERFDIFKTNWLEIQRHNSDSTQNFTQGINQFTDLTSDEFNQKYLGGIIADKNLVGLYGCGLFSTDAESNSFPDSIDWRQEGAVTVVNDQGQCGSCWTFSATGAMEGAWAIATGDLVSLSEEQLADCATGYKYGSHGCNGGQMDGGFKYAIENGCADEIVHVSCNDKLTKQNETQEYNNYEITFSKCPLIELPIEVKKLKSKIDDYF